MTTRIRGHVDRLCVQLGPRPIGSPHNRLAQDYVAGVLADLGYDVELQDYLCPAWGDHGTTLTVDGSPVPALANPFSPSCDVTGPAVPFPTFEALERADLTGAVAVLYGELTRTPLAAAAWFLAGERDLAIPRLLVAKGAIAVLTVPPVVRETERVIEDADFPLPSATVPSRDAAPLLSGSQIHLRIAAATAEGRTANVVGRLNCRPGASRAVVCAHYDSKVDTPGATDNGTGVAVLLDVAERLSGSDVAVELVAFTGEEYLPIGDDEYLHRRAGDLSDVVAAVNVDGAGHALDLTTVMETAGSGPLREALEAEVAKHPDIVWVDPWPESNHSTFSMRGVPAAAFSSPQARELSHLRSDTVDVVDVRRLSEIGEVIELVVRALTATGPREAPSLASES
jgi:aminopeptidase YwaD